MESCQPIKRLKVKKKKILNVEQDITNQMLR